MEASGDIPVGKIDELRRIINDCDNIVFFGGAGVSTESGIPDFRGTYGMYSQQSRIPAETILSHDFFMDYPEHFYDFYREKLIYPDAKPNKAHLRLAELEKAGKLKAVITQNIDNLHQTAGSESVVELHGSVYRNYCMKCGEPEDYRVIFTGKGVPVCKQCGGRVRPDVTLYGEGLSPGVITEAVRRISETGALIVGGTSLTVYPAAGFIGYFGGGPLVIINKTETSLDSRAALVIRGSIGEALDRAGARHAF